jgi:hypothetical protein
MRFHPQTRQFQNPRASAVLARVRFFAALWLLVSMAAHSLDACASHFGFPDALETPTALLSEPDCIQENCVTCSPSHDDHADLCDTLSETATRNSQNSKLKAPVADGISWAIVPQIAFALKPPKNIIRNRDGPEDFSLPPSPTGSTFSGRAPPFSA